MTNDIRKLHEKHRRFLFDHSPVDRMIEDQGIDTWNGMAESRFIASAGGDVSTWVVTGWLEPFGLGQK